MVKRDLSKNFLQLNIKVEVFAFVGTTQSGKTALFKNLASPDRKYADLAEPALRSMGRGRRCLFIIR